MARVVFFHLEANQGKNAVLRTAMTHATRMGHEVYLITNSSWLATPGVTTVRFDDVAGREPDFRRIYVHLSPNARAFEYNCFARWFAFAELARSLGEFYVCDSDLLLFPGFEDAARLKRADQIFNSAWFNHCTGPGSLDVFCDFLLERYSGPVTVDFTCKEVNEMIRWGDRRHLCDMHLLYLFALKHRGKVFDLKEGRANQLGFDTNINSGWGYEVHEGGVKKILWKDGIPHATRVQGGDVVRFRTLHFQGISKPLMMFYAFLPETARHNPEFSIQPHSKAAWWKDVSAELERHGGRLALDAAAQTLDPLSPYLETQAS